MNSLKTSSTTGPGRLGVWIVAAVALRLVLMPFTLHGDLLFVNYFPYHLSYLGVWDIYGYFGDHYVRQYGYSYYAPMVYYLVGFFQCAFKSLSPSFAALMQNIHTHLYAYSPLTPAECLRPFAGPEAWRLVAVMKLPYFLADILCVALIARVFGTSDRKKAVLLWLWNPVLVFSVYIFGQYRIYPALFLWLVIFLVQKGRREWACICLGLMCLMDNFPWILLLPSVVILGRNRPERVRLAALVLLPFFVIFVPLYVSSQGFVFYAYFAPIYGVAVRQSLTLHFAPQVALAAKALLAAGYTRLLFLLFSGHWPISGIDDKARVAFFIRLNAAILFLFYATSQTLVHYFMWVLPFLVFLQVFEDHRFYRLSWLLMLCLFLFNLDTRSLNAGLLLPILLEKAMEIPSLHEVMGRFLPWGSVVAFSRLLFSAVCLYLAWALMAREMRPEIKNA